MFTKVLSTASTFYRDPNDTSGSPEGTVANFPSPCSTVGTIFSPTESTLVRGPTYFGAYYDGSRSLCS